MREERDEDLCLLGMRRSVVRWFVTDVSKNRNVLIFAIPEDQEELRLSSCTACPSTVKQLQENRLTLLAST